jgi:uncharacterized protein (DUF427 family)
MELLEPTDETRLPVRYYIPKLDVRMDLLDPSPTRTLPLQGAKRPIGM